MDKEIFVQNIKTQCSLRGVKPTIACRESGAGADLINQMERRGSVPSVERVQLLANYLGVTVSELLGEESPSFAHTEGQGTPTPDEQQLIRKYRSLNKEGQEKLLDLADDLVSSGKYIKSSPPRMGKEA